MIRIRSDRSRRGREIEVTGKAVVNYLVETAVDLSVRLISQSDVDDTDSYGPENIWLANPEPGTYTVMVEHWGGGSAESDGEVIFNVAGQVVVAKMNNLAPQSVWTAGTITWPEGLVEISSEIYDCSATWSSGCVADIP